MQIEVERHMRREKGVSVKYPGMVLFTAVFKSQSAIDFIHRYRNKYTVFPHLTMI